MNKLIGEDKIIGRGWSFPPSFDPITQQTNMVTGEEDIYQSLRVLFNTQPGERVLALKYGCDLSPLLFGKISLTQKTLLENKIKNAILDFESRILVNKLSIDLTQVLDGKISIQIDFTIDHTNNRQNIVFPFFLEEGTLLPSIY